MFGNPFAARYVAKSEDNGERGAGEAGGNRRRVGWYKANRASQEDSFAPPFLPFASSSSSQFSTCSFHSTAGLPFKLLRAPGIVFSCLLILVLLFRVTLTTNLCSSVKILFASRPLSCLPSLSLIYSFGRVKFCGFKLPVRATLSISDIRHARVKLAFSCIS